MIRAGSIAVPAWRFLAFGTQVAINGDDLVVKDESGSEGHIHVGTDTEKYGHFQPGDRIEAWVYPDGHAKTIVIIRSAAVIQEDQADRQQQAQR